MRNARIIGLAALAFAAVLFLPELMPSGPSLSLDVAGSLTGGKLALGLFFVYLMGVGTSLTPCVYPLIPITLSVMGVQKGGSRLANAGLATAYVGGMVLTYDAVGIGLIALHKTSATLLANPMVITPIAILFIVLAMPMFGVFELGLPAPLQERLNKVGGPGLLGSLAMGLVAGLVAAPCSGPVTALIAGIVSGTSNYALGTLLMTIYAIGIGTLFFLLAAFSVQLPRSGGWMEGVKSFFGIALVALALLYLKDAFPGFRAAMTSIGLAVRHIAPWAAGAVALGVLLGALHRSFHGSGPEKALKAAGVSLAIVGIFLRLGVSVPPAMAEAARGTPEGAFHFLTLEEGLALASAQHRPVLIDFGAEWCAACKELEKVTYVDPAVRAEAARFIPVKVDGTVETDAIEDLYAKYGVSGLPTVVFLDSKGEQDTALKLIGFEPPAKFLERLKKIQ